MPKKRRGESHVRLYRHELECEAYRSLSTDARALLVEFRALYCGQENRIYMSVRQMMRRLNVGQRKAQRARDDLLDRGFVRLLSSGGFNRKIRHASEYALTNEPLEPDCDGATAPKDFMRWQPQKSTVANSATDGSRSDYRGNGKKAQKFSHGSCSDYRDLQSGQRHGSRSDYTDRLPGTPAISGGSEGLLASALVVDSEPQFKLCVAALLASADREKAA